MKNPGIDLRTIDKRMRLLVRVLNTIPGLQTHTSCGGHKKNKNRGDRAPYGGFYVDFVCRMNSADTSIPVIQQGIGPYSDKVTLRRNREGEKIHKDLLHAGDTVWMLSGKEIHPDMIAYQLLSELEKKK
jgi:hypothetical protein